MKDIFKKTKKSPIKLTGYDYIGQHPDYEFIHYFIRNLGNDNYDFVEAKLDKKKRKYELSAGTSIKVLDSFMFNCLKADIEGTKFDSKKAFIEYVYDNSFTDSETSKEDFVSIYNTKIPNSISTQEEFKKAKKEGFEVLYCGKALQKKKFETYSVVLVKKEELDVYGLKREFTRFKSILYMTKPSYIKKQGVEQFNEFPQSDLTIVHDILNK